MSDASLEQALVRIVRDSFDRSSDGLVRIDPRSQLPWLGALRALLEWDPALEIGVLTPSLASSLAASGLACETDPRLMTAWRNDPDRHARVLYIGPATGAGQQGLRDLNQVLSFDDIAGAWAIEIHDRLGVFRDRELEIRRGVLDAIVDLVTRRVRTPRAVAEYIDEIALNPSVDISDLQGELWRLELLPDQSLVSAATSISSRVALNVDVMEGLLGDDDRAERDRKKLRASSANEASHVLSFVASREIEDLSRCDLDGVLSVLRGGSKPPPPDRVPTMLDALSSKPLDVVAAIDAFAELIGDLTELDAVDVTATEPEEMRLVIRDASSAVKVWQASDSPAGDENEPFAVLELRDHSGEVMPVTFDASLLSAELDGLVDQAIVDEFRSRRLDLMKFKHRLAIPDEELLSVLLVSEPLREAAAKYLAAWRALLDAFSAVVEKHADLGALLALGDAVWSRPLGDGETFESAIVEASHGYEQARLAPFHPWRLDPLLSLTETVLAGGTQAENAVEAARWALSKAVPIFRVLKVGRADLHFSASRDGWAEFTRDQENTLFATPNRVRELSRTLNAYVRTHPWATAGATILVANSPNGALIGNLVRGTQPALGHEPQTLVITDRETIGVDRNLPTLELLELFQEERLADSEVLRVVGRDLTLGFLPGRRGTSHNLSEGAIGSVELQLRKKGVGVAGQRSIPTITLSADPSNQTIALLHQVAGTAGRPVQEFDLALPPSAARSIPLLANNTEWLVIGAPAFVSSFEVQDSHGHVFHRLTEFDGGEYKYLLFARDLEPLGVAVRERMAALPIASPSLASVQSLVNELSSRLPQKVFDVALNRFGTEEALGLINARAIAHVASSDTDLVLEISLDHAGWAQQLAGDDNRRADFIIVTIDGEPDAEDPIRIVVVEAKATTKEFASPRSEAEPFTEAIGQAEATRAFLTRVVASAEEGLLEGVQFRSFVEQLATRAASEYLSSKDEDKQRRFPTYFEHISKLSRSGRRLPPISSLVVVSFLEGVQPMVRVGDDDLEMISASSHLLGQVLRDEPFDLPALTPPDSPEDVAPSSRDESQVQGGGPEDSSGNVATNLANSAVAAGTSADDQNRDDLTNQVILTSVTNALRLRSESVGRAEDANISVGPTFASVSLPFERGAAIAPLQRAELDLARDLGVSTVEIDNDQVEGRIRVLVPRKARQFPQLSRSEVLASTKGTHYLPLLLGQDLRGEQVDVPLSTWPHALVAGSTGSGKTTLLRSLLFQINCWGPSQTNAVVVDGKGETDYFGVLEPAMFAPEFPEPQLTAAAAVDVLQWLSDSEVPRRKGLLLELAKQRAGRVDARSLYLEAALAGESAPIRPLVVVVDEFNEIMIRGGTDKERFVESVTSVAQTGRSVLVHLVLATQRPDRNVVPGSIKANLPTRISLRLPTATDSVTVLGHGGAERLIGWGDMLVQVNGEPDQRLQSFITP